MSSSMCVSVHIYECVCVCMCTCMVRTFKFHSLSNFPAYIAINSSHHAVHQICRMYSSCWDDIFAPTIFLRFIRCFTSSLHLLFCTHSKPPASALWHLPQQGPLLPHFFSVPHSLVSSRGLSSPPSDFVNVWMLILHSWTVHLPCQKRKPLGIEIISIYYGDIIFSIMQKFMPLMLNSGNLDYVMPVLSKYIFHLY